MILKRFPPMGVYETLFRFADASGKFYSQQRARYADGLQDLGFELFTGTGGFYHWATCKFCENASAEFGYALAQPTNRVFCLLGPRVSVAETRKVRITVRWRKYLSR